MPLLQFKFTKLSKIIGCLLAPQLRKTQLREPLNQPWPYRPTPSFNRQETWLLNEQETTRSLTLLSPIHSWGTSNNNKFHEPVKGGIPPKIVRFFLALEWQNENSSDTTPAGKGLENHFSAAGLIVKRAPAKAADYSASKYFRARTHSQPTPTATPTSTAKSSQSIATSGTPLPRESTP